MERFVDVPGSRLFAVEEGAGPPIVLLHAWVANHRAWDAMVPGLVGAGHRVIRYDMRSFGASPTQDVEFSHRTDLLAVMDAFGIEKAAIVGNSGGGRTAIETAVEFPGRVEAVVAVGAGLQGYAGEIAPVERALFAEWAQVSGTDPIDVDAITELGLRVWLDGPGQPPDRVPAAVRESLRAMSRPLNEPARVRGTAIELDPPIIDRMSDLRCPVLAIAGALDLVSIAGAALRMEADAPNTRAAIMPGVAHMIGMEAPEALNAMVLEFLSGLQPES
jgi:3-oxoadipate enol-lactonase